MSSDDRGTTLRRIDYGSTFRFTEIFRSFKIATQPGKMSLGLLLVVVMFVFGWLLDGLVGRGALPGEFEAYSQSPTPRAFDQWRSDQEATAADNLRFLLNRHSALNREAIDALVTNVDRRWSAAESAIEAYYAEMAASARERLERLADDDEAPERIDAMEAELERIITAGNRAQRELDQWRPTGVFSLALRIKIDAFENMINAAFATILQLDPSHIGFGQLDPAEPLDRDTIAGAVRTVAYEMPGWLWHAHPWFLVVWIIVFIAVWSLLGGAICRLAVVEAATSERLTLGDGMAFAFRRWFSFAVMPLLPLVFLGLFALLLSIAGLLFLVPGLDVVAAILWGLAIGVGLLLALGLIGWLGSVHLMYPSLAAEGTDVFDGVSRGYSYVVRRPWRFVWYTLVALVYGAITYVFLGLVLWLTLYLAQGATSAWTAVFDRMLPSPELRQIDYEFDTTGLSATRNVAAVIIKVWVMLTVALVAAYAISYYFTAYSTIYLLLRRECDGTDPAQVYLEHEPTAPPTAGGAAVNPGVDQADDQ